MSHTKSASQQKDTSAEAPKHTPGNLVVTGHTTDCDGTGMSCAWITDEDCTVSIEIKAKNAYGTVCDLAHLIAAVPDLLAAVRLALRDVDSSLYLWPVNHNGTPKHKGLLKQQEVYRAAIARAQGGAK